MPRLLAWALPVLALVLATSTAYSDDPLTGPFEPEVSYTPANPDIGDILLLTITLETPETVLVNFPRLPQKVAGFLVTGRLAPEPGLGEDGTRTWAQTYRLEPQTTGTRELPPFSITVQDPATLKAVYIDTGVTEIPIRSLVAPDADHRFIKDLAAPIELPLIPVDWIATAIVAGIAIFYLGGIAVLLRPRPRPATEMQEVMPDPRMRLLSDLGRLDWSNVPDDRANRDFHVALSDIVRRYAQVAHAIAAPRRTTEELVMATQVDGLAEIAGSALRQCDEVKFGRSLPGAERREQVYTAAKAFVVAAEPAQSETTVKHDAVC